MIKAKVFDKSDGNKTALVILGITERNIELLKQDKPIQIHGKEIGIDFDIVITFGKSEKDIYDNFKRAGMIGPDTEFHGVAPDFGEGQPN